MRADVAALESESNVHLEMAGVGWMEEFWEDQDLF